MENGINAFLLITCDGVDEQVWCLHSFCSKFNGGSERLFRFWLRSIFHGQNTWKTEHAFDMNLVPGDVLTKEATFSQMFCAISSYFRFTKFLKTPYR